MEKEEIANNEDEGLDPEPESHLKEFKNLENELKDIKDQLFRARAEMENQRKRIEE